MTQISLSSQLGFSDLHKQAITSIIVEMINCDGIITLDEVNVLNIINQQLGISSDLFFAGKAFDFSHALTVADSMTDAQKRYLMQTLVNIIDADGVATREEWLLEHIGKSIHYLAE